MGDSFLFWEMWRLPSERQWETAENTVVFANEQDVQEVWILVYYYWAQDKLKQDNLQRV